MTDPDPPQDGSHPDSHELNDWHLFGPKNSEIADLVYRLAYEKGMRLADIERLMVEALKERLFLHE
ncbi:hypothetical protein MUY35_04030 [Aliiroseovarius sp. S1339]|uniref:hypothetical protein n=1 Tax=Aliiroseovarius sp. S1339 TaxID=2936990 RepID=UPI0020BF02F2|nr:hypothetical protein [Aliiroseovarius sp. S1339]MCK8463015.1 hypothetical protein [Aliiroseovarius sp. S1339]